MAVLDRCPGYRGVRIIEVSGLDRCPDWRGVRIGEVHYHSHIGEDIILCFHTV